MALRSLVLAVLVSALAAGQAAGADGERYTGKSTGGIKGCAPWDFDLVVSGGQITGRARTAVALRGSDAVFEITGTVGADRAVVLEATTSDDRVRHREVRWRGQAEDTRMEIEDKGSQGCAARHATLTRR